MEKKQNNLSNNTASLKNNFGGASTILQGIAHVVSYLFHPILLPTYCILLLMWANPFYIASIKSAQGYQLFVSVFFNTCLLPVFIMRMFKNLGFIKDFNLDDRKERALPYLLMISFLFWAWFVLKFYMGFPAIVHETLWGCFLSVMAAYFVNIFYFKISMHTLGMGGLFVVALRASFIATSNIQLALIAVILIGGLVGTARLILNAHKPVEIYYGYFLGILLMWFAYM